MRAEYDEEGEELEHVGERLALLDDDGGQVGTVEVTAVGTVAFAEVPWEFAHAEGEGDADLEEWRAGHRRYWERLGTPVTDETPIVCLRFRLV
nr:ASCH domain-containing protein [Nocardioides sp. IC4_145]